MSKLHQLQNEWYQKLKESGFDDIEDKRGNVRQHNIRTIAYENQDLIRDFFTHLGEYLSTQVLPELHSQILHLYCEGIYIKVIAQKVGRTDRTVRAIIRIYREKILKTSDFAPK